PRLWTYTFPADFVVVDYEVDPRVPLILGRPFLRMAHALVNVHGEKLTLRTGDEELVFNVESTSKYPRKHGDESIHKIDILDIACEDHFHEVLNVQKSINPMSGSPTLSPGPMLESLSPSLTPFRDNNFLLEETDTFLSLDDSIPPGIDNGIYDSEGDILFLEQLLNKDLTPNLPPIPHLVCLINEIEKIKSSIDDPLDLELKDLPPHLKYAFLKGTSKLPIIIAKDLKREEKAQLLKVLKSHKQAIAWKISDIRGTGPNFCTHKILMEDDFKPVVQHQRWVNPKIHEVIKAEVIKLLDAGLIYPIFDSPWVSSIHVVPKKRDGFSGYFQIPIDPQDQDKTTFTCPYGTFAYRRMPFGIVMLLGRIHSHVPSLPLDMMLKWCEDTNLVLNWEKCISMCQSSFEILKKKLTEAPILVSPDWDLPFELMCDAVILQWSMHNNNNNNNNIVFETRVSKHTQSHIQLVSSDTTRPPHHHVAVAVAATDSTAGSTGRTGAEHNQVGYKHPATEHYKLLPCAQRHPGKYPSDMHVCTPSSLSPPV
ncbi:hypothetical protein Tco_0373817, partial [Tanacetum coccineum]